jgi:TonB family protein
MDAPIQPVSTRLRRLRELYDRRWRLALGLSLMLHGAFTLTFLGHSFPVPDRSMIASSVGYPGPMRVVDLAPLHQVISSQELMARRRALDGAMVNQDLATTEGAPAPSNVAPETDIGVRTTTSPRTGSTTAPAPIVIELGEDLQARDTGAAPALSETFQVLRIVRPEYPSAAIWNQVQGLVKLRVQVGVTGRVLDVKVAENTSGSEILERAACDAMYQWEFRPFHQGRNAVPFTIIVPFRFRLES